MTDANGNGFTVKEIVVRLEEKVDKVLDDHERRIRKVESRQSRWQGGKAVVVGALAIVASASSLIIALVR